MKKHLGEYLLSFDKGHSWVTQTLSKIYNLPPPQKALLCSFQSAPSATSPRQHLISSHHRWLCGSRLSYTREHKFHLYKDAATRHVLRFIYVTLSISCSLLLLNSISWHEYSSLFTHLPLQGLLAVSSARILDYPAVSISGHVPWRA